MDHDLPMVATAGRRSRSRVCVACAAAAALAIGCSLRTLDDLEAHAARADAPLEPSILPDAGVCIHDSECGPGRCREELGRCELCPDDMRLVRRPNGEAFCIEAREVSRGDYGSFLQAIEQVEPSNALDFEHPQVMCEAKVEFRPGEGADCQSDFRADADPSLPITCVDLCDAMAYCHWRGRRLCGGPRGTKIGSPRVDTPADEWLTACSQGGTRPFPYGDVYEPWCNIRSSELVPVDERERCSTEDGIAQLNGNAAEWVLICRSPAGVQECLVRGGEYRSEDVNAAGCYLPRQGVDVVVPPMVLSTLARSPGVGIRCCAD